MSLYQQTRQTWDRKLQDTLILLSFVQNCILLYRTNVNLFFWTRHVDAPDLEAGIRSKLMPRSFFIISKQIFIELVLNLMRLVKGDIASFILQAKWSKFDSLNYTNLDFSNETQTTFILGPHVQFLICGPNSLLSSSVQACQWPIRVKCVEEASKTCRVAVLKDQD